MARTRSKTLAQRLQEKQNSRVADYDPEALQGHSDGDENSGEGTGSDSDDNEFDGTEHYVAVGQSKLRKRAPLTSLGPRYQGSRVSRAALKDQNNDDDGDDDQDEDEDSFVTAREDESASESRESSVQAPERAFRNPRIQKRPVAADLWETSEQHGTDDGGDGDGVVEEEGWAEEDDDDTVVGAGEGGNAIRNGESWKEDADEDEDEDEEEDEDETMGGLVDDEAISDDEEGEDDDDEEDGDPEEEDESDDNEDVLGLNGFEDDDSEVDEDEDDDEDEGGVPVTTQPTNLKQASRLDGNQKAISSLSQAAQRDTQKGRAIRQQRAIFDGLLNIRIRLQKALVSANSFHVLDAEPKAEEEAYAAAENAAVNLWNALDSMRSRYDAQVGEKRKRSPDDDSEQLWEEMQAFQERRDQHRDRTLDKWSTKMRNNENRGNQSLKPLVSALQDQLVEPTGRLVKRSRVPRSCAPIQAARKVTEDAGIYDDADFYQLLLKELVDQRTVESVSASQMVSGAIASSAVAPGDVRQGKVVDRKASKGRVMRFTVHEKLLSFMAPQDRRSWEQGAIDRFFGTLFGRKAELDEEDQPSEDDDEVMAGADGLRLFR